MLIGLEVFCWAMLKRLTDLLFEKIFTRLSFSGLLVNMFAFLHYLIYWSSNILGDSSFFGDVFADRSCCLVELASNSLYFSLSRLACS